MNKDLIVKVSIYNIFLHIFHCLVIHPIHIDVYIAKIHGRDINLVASSIWKS